MRRREFLTGLGATAAVLKTGLAQTTAGAPDAVQAELDRQVATGLVAGCVCTTVGGRTWFGGRMRFDPPVPMRPDALFDLASAAKTFTAGLCALLYAEGRLDPDAPFTDYLPEHVLAQERHGITVRDLATHTGGFDNAKPYIVAAASTRSGPSVRAASPTTTPART